MPRRALWIFLSFQAENGSAKAFLRPGNQYSGKKLLAVSHK